MTAKLPINLIGNYQRVGKTLHNDSNKLLIADRKNTTQSKLNTFILRYEGKHKHYISTLYPLSDLVYKFDFQGVKYEMELLEDSANIKKLKN